MQIKMIQLIRITDGNIIFIIIIIFYSIEMIVYCLFLYRFRITDIGLIGHTRMLHAVYRHTCNFKEMKSINNIGNGIVCTLYIWKEFILWLYHTVGAPAMNTWKFVQFAAFFFILFFWALHECRNGFTSTALISFNFCNDMGSNHEQ